MLMKHENIIPLLDFIMMDKYYVVCHFKCKVKNKTVISSVAFEPYDGKIELTWQDIIFHPIRSYNRYYHTPITIYSNSCHETIVLKAFMNVSQKFRWDSQEQQYIIR